MVRLALLALGLLTLPAAAQEPAAVFTGEATYRERIALPPEAEVAVALRETAGGEPGAVVADEAEPTEGAQVPLPFRLEVPAHLLVPDSPYALQVAIRLPDGVRWLSDPVTVEPADGTVDVGEVILRSHRPLAFATVWRCGDVTARLGVAGDRNVLDVEGRSFTMVETAAASGARYEAQGDPSTVLWSRGEEAMLTVEGEELAACRLAAEPVSGREALAGGEWVVETIGGAPVLADAPTATMTFEDGRVAGRGSCNRYTASFAVNGPRLAVDPRIAVTQMACAPPILDQEFAFLEALAAARTWELEDGTLVLEGGATIRARRATE